MTVALPISAPLLPVSRGPSLWELGEELQGESRWLQQLAERLHSSEEADQAQAIADLEEALAAEEGQREVLHRKADATCWVIERMRGEAEYLQVQARRFTALARGEANRADALERSLLQVLTRLEPGASSFRFRDHRITSRLSDAVEVDAAEALPAELLTTTTSSNPDKQAIRERIKALIRTAVSDLEPEEAARVAFDLAATAVPGARLVQRRSWTIR